MDTRNGRVYPSPEAARQAGVPEQFIAEVSSDELRAMALSVRIDRNAKAHAKKKSARKTAARSRRQNRSAK